MSTFNRTGWALYFGVCFVSIIAIWFYHLLSVLGLSGYYRNQFWDNICISSAVLGCFSSVPSAHFLLLRLHNLQSQPDPLADMSDLDQRTNSYTGWFGALMFCVGMYDLVLDLLLAREVYIAEQYLLCVAVATSTAG